MRTRRIYWLLSLTWVFMLLGFYPGWGQPLDRQQPQVKRRGPIITHAFAVEKGYYGNVWKIYLEAEDPDGQMLKIASVVDEVGYGQYPTDWIYLKPENQQHFRGYIQWNTFSSTASYLPEWTQVTLNVSVVDKAGNESNQVVFPFTFEITPNQYSYKPPAPFNQGNIPLLGHITVDLYYPGEGGYRHDREMH